jgi:hypothetical protein
MIISSNNARQSLYLQNVGTFPIYLKKGTPGTSTIAAPSITNYDFALAAGTAANDGKGGVLKVDTIAAFIGVAVGGTSSIAVMETALASSI